MEVYRGEGVAWGSLEKKVPAGSQLATEQDTTPPAVGTGHKKSPAPGCSTGFSSLTSSWCSQTRGSSHLTSSRSCPPFGLPSPFPYAFPNPFPVSVLGASRQPLRNADGFWGSWIKHGRFLNSVVAFTELAFTERGKPELKRAVEDCDDRWLQISVRSHRTRSKADYESTKSVEIGCEFIGDPRSGCQPPFVDPHFPPYPLPPLAAKSSLGERTKKY